MTTAPLLVFMEAGRFFLLGRSSGGAGELIAVNNFPRFDQVF